MARLWAGLALVVLVGCGGAMQREEAGDVGAGGGGAGGGGASAGGGASGVGAEGEAPRFYFDDGFPWFDGEGAMVFMPGSEGRVLYLPVEGVPARGTLSTHNLFELTAQATSLRFSARMSAPSELRVAVGHLQTSYDFFAARDAGAPWPSASVMVGTDWREFEVRFADLSPAEPPEAMGQQRFYMAFIVDHPEAIELWVDAVSAQ